jgi:hypothetical protein
MDDTTLTEDLIVENAKIKADLEAALRREVNMKTANFRIIGILAMLALLCVLLFAADVMINGW